MNSIKLVILKLKKLIIPFCICLFTILLLIFSKNNLTSAKAGLILWANSVVPSLLPFFIATELLSYTSAVSYFGKLLQGCFAAFYTYLILNNFSFFNLDLEQSDFKSPFVLADLSFRMK